jgi:hypothetical protein
MIPSVGSGPPMIRAVGSGPPMIPADPLRVVIALKPTAAVKTIRSNTTTATHLFITSPSKGKIPHREGTRGRVPCQEQSSMRVSKGYTRLPLVPGSLLLRASPNCRESNYGLRPARSMLRRYYSAEVAGLPKNARRALELRWLQHGDHGPTIPRVQHCKRVLIISTRVPRTLRRRGRRGQAASSAPFHARGENRWPG